ncbi:MAG: hypothetical protein ACK5Q5_08550 [Planctomycetaceae bacterium]
MSQSRYRTRSMLTDLVSRGWSADGTSDGAVRPGKDRRWSRLVGLTCLIGIGLSLAGCVRALALGSKVLMGDPKTVSTFEQRTQVELQSGEFAVAVVVDAPHQILDEYDRIVDDVQRELLHQMGRHGVKVVPSAEVHSAIEDAGGIFVPQQLAQKIDADYIMHVQLHAFTDHLGGSPNLLQCQANGLVVGYEVRRGIDGETSVVVSRYEEPFRTLYPTGHPEPADQISSGVFLQECTREIAKSIGMHMYDMPTAELY